MVEESTDTKCVPVCSLYSDIASLLYEILKIGAAQELRLWEADTQ